MKAASAALLLLGLAFACGCATRPPIAVGAKDTEIRATVRGFYVGEQPVRPEEIPGMLEDTEVPYERTIHIRVAKDVRNLAPARALMKRLARAGYRSSILVTERHAESVIVSNAEATKSSSSQPNRPSGKPVPPQPKTIRYKRASE